MRGDRGFVFSVSAEHVVCFCIGMCILVAHELNRVHGARERMVMGWKRFSFASCEVRETVHNVK